MKITSTISSSFMSTILDTTASETSKVTTDGQAAETTLTERSVSPTSSESPSTNPSTSISSSNLRTTSPATTSTSESSFATTVPDRATSKSHEETQQTAEAATRSTVTSLQPLSTTEPIMSLSTTSSEPGTTQISEAPATATSLPPNREQTDGQSDARTVPTERMTNQTSGMIYGIIGGVGVLGLAVLAVLIIIAVRRSNRRKAQPSPSSSEKYFFNMDALRPNQSQSTVPPAPAGDNFYYTLESPSSTTNIFEADDSSHTYVDVNPQPVLTTFMGDIPDDVMVDNILYAPGPANRSETSQNKDM